jgi:alpha-ketoglutarate-dependent taurine dioxygenase
MVITKQTDGKFGVVVDGFHAATATDADFAELRQQVYANKIAVLKNQELSTDEFVEMGKRLGEPAAYYEPVYHHPENPLVFVSSNVPKDGKQIGVPKTGKFWHADYQFMDKPFALTLIYPQVVPRQSRGTYFIDMGAAYTALPPSVKDAVVDAIAVHSPRRFFKIRPSDAYRPIGELLTEIETRTPEVNHRAVIRHPVTGEPVLYLSEGFTTGLKDHQSNDLGEDLLRRLLAETGQLDQTFEHDNIHLQSFTEGDLLIWDNRSLVHRALHTTTPEPAVSFRVTVYDDHPFDGNLDGDTRT